MDLYIKKYLLLNYASILLLILFISEAYFKIVHFSTGEESILLQVIKGIVLVVLGLYVLKKPPKNLLLLLVLFVSFLFGQLTLKGSINKAVVIAFVKFVYPIVLLIFFNIYILANNQKEKLFLAFEYVILFNSLLIIFGFLFNITIFNSYLGSRFGFNGLLITSATSSYVYCIALVYLLAKYKTSIFNRIPNLIIIGSMFLLGTKASYLFLVCFFTIYFLKYTVINKKIIVGALLTICGLGFYIFFFKYGVFNEIRQSDGLISSLLSYRDKLLLERTIPYIRENWSLKNYIFGGVLEMSTKSQIELIDVFYFFGLFGGLLYFYMFLKAFLIIKLNIHVILLLSIVFFIVLLAGNFFSYPSIAIYLVVLREYLKINEQNKHPEHLNS